MTDRNSRSTRSCTLTLRSLRIVAESTGLVMLAAASLACSAAEDSRDIDLEDDRGSAQSFDRNALVPDAAMLDSTAFSVAEIDAFLADPYDDGLASCLAKERFGGKTPGELIHQTAVQYGLNPLFLLAHLQKESSLVGATGTCSQVLMDEAFGCGCPDGSGCDPQYAGFANQLDCAGDLTRSYLDDLGAGKPTISGWAVGQAKSTLDPQTVTPANRATAVLYTYTPWVGDRDAGGNPAPFGNYLFWQVWNQYAEVLGYTTPTGDDPPPPPPPEDPEDPEDPPSSGGLADWSYILDTDLGLRDDPLGAGYFQAPRAGGRLHTGLDFLGQRGEPLYAPCAGEALSGGSGSFGNWVQLVCPVELGGKTIYASLLYTHNDRNDVGHSGWQTVSKDTQVGTLGASGNAVNTNPHVHFEIIFHASRNEALNEFHSGGDVSNNATADEVVAIFQEQCLEPNGFNSKNPTDIIRYGRRFDPFIAMICLGANKAPMQNPPASLQSTPVPWSTWYGASAFDVDTEHL